MINWSPLRDIDRIFNRLHPLSTRIDENGPGIALTNAGLRRVEVK